MSALGAYFKRGITALLDEMTSWQAMMGFPHTARGTFLLVDEGTKLACYRVARARPVHKADGAREALRDGWLNRIVGTHPIELRLAGDGVVVRSLRLPAASRGHIEAIIRHQVEQIMPWPSEKMVYDYDIQESEAARFSGQFDVRIVATSLTAVRSAIEPFQSVGITPVVVGLASDPSDRPSAINLLPGAKAALRLRRRHNALVCLCILAAAGAALLAGAGWSINRAIAETARIEASLASLRGAVEAARKEAETKNDPAMDVARKWDAVPMVLLLEELSRRVPDTTYLTALDVDDRNVRVTGLSTNAADLISLLEGSDMLEAAGFSAPIVRDNDSKLERFEILAHFSEKDRP
ncbi:PilN domain-containing protein [Ensifer sp. HO-A22]|uniref:PilN domain-containing protein n=1 Tax=Ensifer oleiphilus TaxID=2742698 RepID=A0A7Y6UQL4_9HYPH|nr:PilN domain-containing protein [Ensifer oleiphilus]NVD42645.1 PilN domain-containing protein [Ensifer oleiphilus]